MRSCVWESDQRIAPAAFYLRAQRMFEDLHFALNMMDQCGFVDRPGWFQLVIGVRPLSIQVKIEVLAAGLPLHHRALMTVDTTLRSVLTATGTRQQEVGFGGQSEAGGDSHGMASWVEPVSSSVSRAELSHFTTEEKQRRANAFPSWRCTCGGNSQKTGLLCRQCARRRVTKIDSSGSDEPLVRRQTAGTSKRSMTRGSQKIKRTHVVNRAHV